MNEDDDITESIDFEADAQVCGGFEFAPLVGAVELVVIFSVG